MAEITASLVKELRERTGAGMMDCKKALMEMNGDMDKAIDYLREKGIAKAVKKAGRIAAEGLVFDGVSADHKMAVLIEFNSETDFVAKNVEFKEFGKRLTQIAIDNKATTVDALNAAEFAPGKTVAVAVTDLIAKIIEKILVGKMNKFYEENCLVDQIYVRAENKETVAKFAAPLKVVSFARYKVGDGIEKKEEDFAAEVAAQIKG